MKIKYSEKKLSDAHTGRDRMEKKKIHKNPYNISSIIPIIF